MVKLNKYKIQASSLLESLIAMVVIAIVFSLGLMTIESVLNNQKEALLFRVNMAINYEADLAKSQLDIMDDNIMKGDFIIKKEWLDYQNRNGILELRLTAIDENENILTQRKELLRIKQ